MPDQITGTGTSTTRTRLLAITTGILVIAALKLSYHVTVPFLVAVFLMTLAWPFQARLERRIPRWLALLVTMLAVFAIFGLIGWAFVYSANRIAERAPELSERLTRLTADVSEWARARNLPIPSGTGLGSNRLAPFLGAIASALYSTAGTLALVVAFLVLGLLEVRDFDKKVTWRLKRGLGEGVHIAAVTIASRIRRYLVALSITSAISGLATGVFAMAMGLELAVMWGFIAFILNYVPTLGPFVAILPPTAFALLQFEGPGRPALVFLGVGAIQFFVGNFLDPKIEGKILSLSPLVVLLAIVFWGWLWGVFGALIAVPLTVAIVIVCGQFESTRWISALLSSLREESDKEPRERGTERREGEAPDASS